MNEFFTSLTSVDRELILKTLSKIRTVQSTLRFLEIGVFGGATARGIKDWCDKNKVALDYWGIDSGQHPDLPNPAAPFDGASFILGDSAEVFWRCPERWFDVVFLDGCHCVNHVILDLLHYRETVRNGGFMILHDTAKHVQQTMKDPHGPEHPYFHNSVLVGMAMIGFPFYGWHLWDEGFDPTATFGGVKIYQKRLGSDGEKYL